MMVRDLTVGAVVAAAEFPWMTAALAVSIAFASGMSLRRVRGTTLTAPAAWCLVSAIAIAVVEAGLAWQGGSNPSLAASLWRYAAAVGTLCPLMAVLGAKRPQNRGWQWVVLSLWIVLLVPSGQALAAPTGERLELFSAWRVILAGLIALGPLNYLATSCSLAACLVAFGQAGLLAAYLFDIPQELQAIGRLVALAALLAAFPAAIVVLKLTRTRLADKQSFEANGFNRRWIDFRDGWGAFWGLRVLQRVNQTAELSDWPMHLHWWRGLVPTERALNANAAAPLDAKTAAQLQQSLDSLLRRFERVNNGH